MRASGTTTTTLHRPGPGRRLLAVLVALSLGAVFVVAVPVTASAAACDAPVVNEIACENTKTGNPSSEWNITGSGSASLQGFATDISVNRGSTIGFKVKTTAASHRLDIYRMGYYGGAGARKITTVNVGHGHHPARLPHGGEHRPLRLRQLDPDRLVGGAEHRGVRHLLRQGGGRDRRQPHRLRGAQRRQHLRRLLPDLRHDLAGLQRLRRQQPVRGQPRGSGVQGVLQPAVRHQRRDPRGLRLERGVPDGAVPRGERLRHQLHQRVGQRPPRQPDQEPQDVPVRRPRRVLVRWPAGQRRSGPGCRGEPGVLQRQRGVLEDPLGEQPGQRRHQHAVPDAGDATRRPTPTTRSTRPRPGPAPGAIHGSARPRTAGGPRTP